MGADLHRQGAQGGGGQGEEADLQRTAGRQGPRPGAIARRRRQAEDLQQLAFHVDGPDVDIAAALEMPEVDDPVPALQVAAPDPQGIDRADPGAQIDVRGRTGPEDADRPRPALFGKGLQEQDRAHIVAQRPAGQQEQHALVAIVALPPGGLRQAGQAALFLNDAEHRGVAQDHVLQEFVRRGQVALPGAAVLACCVAAIVLVEGKRLAGAEGQHARHAGDARAAAPPAASGASGPAVPAAPVRPAAHDGFTA